MPDLLVDVYDAVAVVTLDRPQARNALSAALRADLRAAIAALDARADVRAIVLTGTDPAFCAGVDLVELAEGPAQDLEGPRGAPFLRCTTPLVGAVNGAASTGGLELALCCHLLVASERATFADTHAALGFVPGWGLTVLLTDAVGARRAREMCLASMPVDAATAHDWGLVSRVVAHDALLPDAVALARRIAAAPAAPALNAVLEEQASARGERAFAIEASGWLGARLRGDPGHPPG